MPSWERLQKETTFQLLEKGNTLTEVDSGFSGPPTDDQKVCELQNLRLAQDIFDAICKFFN